MCVFKRNVCMSAHKFRVCMCVWSLCVTGFIRLLQIDGGAASHPIIWPVSQCRERETTGEVERFHLISLNGD